jgi:hypothetical protein
MCLFTKFLEIFLGRQVIRVDLDFVLDDLGCLNFNVSLRIALLLPVYLARGFTALCLVLSICCGITNYDDLVDLFYAVHMVEANLNGLISPTTINPNFI